MSKWKYGQQDNSGGRIVVERFESNLLKTNPLQDPSLRDLPVYVPPSYDQEDRDYPLVVCLSGFTGSA